MSVSQATQQRIGLPNIGHQTLPKILVGFLYGAYSPGNDFELILRVKRRAVMLCDEAYYG